ncbi:MAG TPA: hypothetical protein VJU14_10025 [Solirubrobacterales bacterium]|nr:hypothetical protein [Solirubrobacterales bacterium]
MGALAAFAAFAAWMAADAAADVELVPGSFSADSYEADRSTPDARAGARPSANVNLFKVALAPEGNLTGRIRDTETLLPAGFSGNPEGTPKCPRADFEAMNLERGACPAASQVGLLTLSRAASETPSEAAVYLLEPQSGVLSELGFSELTVATYIQIKLDPATDRLVATVSKTSEGLEVDEVELVLWGVPADSSHNVERAACGQARDVTFAAPPCPVAVPRKPFITNPTQCGVPQTTDFKVNSWTEPTVFASAAYTSPEPIYGCDKLVFKPSLSADASSQSTESASGFSVHLDLPQNEDPDGLGTPPLKTARVTLPEGMSINPASAGGLGACTDAQLGLKTDSPNLCPDNAKLGSVTVKSPALENPVQGSFYLRTQNSTDPESGEMYRAALVLEDPERGLLIKQPGQIKVNKDTGRIETVFADNPQLPVSSIDIELKSGPRATLQTPEACGTYATDYELTSWGGQVVKGQSKFVVNQNCDAGTRFAPGFEAGTVNPVAGKSSAFTMQITRADGEQDVSQIETTLPEGLLAKLKGVALCGEAQAPSGSCPAASQVGTATVGAGAGSNPIYVPEPGKAPTAAYLAGPYKGAPLSLVVKVPAQAGPFDLGTVAVRNALHVDPVTSQVTVKSDPLPQILGGVPISYRDIRVDVDRPDFTLNPTSCEPMAVTGTLVSTKGAAAPVASRFQAADCASLGFRPKLALRLSGAPPRRGGYPKLTATLTMPKEGANVGKAVVTMPETQFLENAHIRTICTRVQYAADNCPKGSVYGYAKAWTPLLDEPLRGPVYLRSSNNKLPDLVASLGGQIEIELAGRIDSVDERLRTTFWSVPDAPVSKFRLTMQGGRKGLLVNNDNLCAAAPRANVRFTGQNGKVAAGNPKVKVAGCGKKRRK